LFLEETTMQAGTNLKQTDNPTGIGLDRASQVPARHLDTDSHISEIFSGHETRMVGVVPSKLRLRVQLGYIELDLTDATFEPGVTTIEIDAFMGYVQVRFPPGVQVESRGHALIGFFSFKGDDAVPAGDAAAARAIVRVTGRVTFGFAEGR
jgi:hypothetical protein